jgi:hypothetical protein
MNALKMIAVWFENLPSEVQADLSCLISAMLPELVAPGADSLFDDGNSFMRRVLRLRPDSDAMAVAGRASTLTAAIDLIFLHRSSEEDWALYGQCIEEARDEAVAAEKKATAAILQSLIDEIPRRRELWIAESRMWRSVRAALATVRSSEAIPLTPILSQRERGG